MTERSEDFSHCEELPVELGHQVVEAATKAQAIQADLNISHAIIIA
jgi:hypothetical protein